MAAHKLGDYATALKEWKPLAAKGHAKTQYKLGLMYKRGRGIARDYGEVVKWFRKAAGQGAVSEQIGLRPAGLARSFCG